MVSGKGALLQQTSGVLILDGTPYRLLAVPPELGMPMDSKSATPEGKEGTSVSTATWELVDGVLYSIEPEATDPDSGQRMPATGFSGCLRYISQRGFCGVCGATLTQRISILAFEQGVLVAHYGEAPDYSEAEIPAFLRPSCRHAAEGTGETD